MSRLVTAVETAISFFFFSITTHVCSMLQRMLVVSLCELVASRALESIMSVMFDSSEFLGS